MEEFYDICISSTFKYYTSYPSVCSMVEQDNMRFLSTYVSSNKQLERKEPRVGWYITKITETCFAKYFETNGKNIEYLFGGGSISRWNENSQGSSLKQKRWSNDS